MLWPIFKLHLLHYYNDKNNSLNTTKQSTNECMLFHFYDMFLVLFISISNVFKKLNSLSENS